MTFRKCWKMDEQMVWSCINPHSCHDSEQIPPEKIKRKTIYNIYIIIIYIFIILYIYKCAWPVLFTNVSIGSSQRKQVQTGIILATIGIVQLAEEQIDYVMDFLVTARLIRNCLKIFFPTIYIKRATYAIENMNSLKIVTAIQFQAEFCLWAALNSRPIRQHKEIHLREMTAFHNVI